MKKILTFIAAALFGAATVFAQDAQTAAAEAAEALSQAEDVPQEAPKPKYWNYTVQTNINFGETYLSQWAAGGYNTVTMAGNVDAGANYAKDKMIWNNRLQLDYGALYSQDKPIFQKNKDRIYFESKWGYETPVRHLSYSANFDFKTQFGDNYDYKAPDDATRALFPGDEAAAWKEAAKNNLKSGLFAPAYINLGFGALWTPAPWFSLNFAPLTGGAVIVSIPELRGTYGMETMDDGSYKSLRLEFGAQLKADASWVINENFTYSTQASLFYNYLKPTTEPRITWDNKVFWKLAKFFALTVSTNLIYDPMVTLTLADGTTGKGVQFKQFLEFGFTYSFTHSR